MLKDLDFNGLEEIMMLAGCRGNLRAKGAFQYDFVAECQYRHRSGLNFFLVQFAVMTSMWPYVAQYP